MSLADGAFLVRFVHAADARPVRGYYLSHVPHVLMQLESDGRLHKEIVRTEHARLISRTPNGGTTNLPFAPAFAWARLAGGEVVWSDGLSPNFQVVDPDSRQRRELVTDLPAAQPVARGELEQWQQARREMMLADNAQWWQQFGCVVEEYDEALYPRPILQRITGTPAGHLLVEGTPQTAAEHATYWLLDTHGQTLATADVPAWGVHLSKHYLLAYTSGPDGETLVHALERSADEVAALTSLPARLTASTTP